MSIKADMKLLTFFTSFFGLITIICGLCTVRLPKDPLLRPQIYHIVGLRKNVLQIGENSEVLHLFKNQKIELYCDTEFERPEKYVHKDRASIECREYRYGNGYDYYFECSPLKWRLYESVSIFQWCDNNMTSYVLARPAKSQSPGIYEYLAGICYDTGANSFKTLYYRLAPQHVHNIHLDILAKFYEPAYEIQHYREIFRKRSVSVEDYNSDIFREWMEYSRYNLSSILQNSRMNKQFYVEALLDFIWWPNLRLGNWKRYEMALEKYIENANHSFDILAGVSDVVKVPILKSCETNFSLVDFNDNVNRKIPFYVWNYLRATDNSTEIVVIGVNSPFYGFYAEKDVIFCSDKCQEISWLKITSSTFRNSPLGVIFCCSVDEVRQSQRLDGFPITTMDTPPLPTATTVYDYIATTTDASENVDNDDNDDNDNYDE